MAEPDRTRQRTQAAQDPPEFSGEDDATLRALTTALEDAIPVLQGRERELLRKGR